MILSKQTFIECLKALKMNYPTWQFDTSNVTILQLWYKRCSIYTEEQFKEIISAWMFTREYPPRSLVDLATAPEQFYRATYPTEKEITEQINNLITRYGASNYRGYKNHEPNYLKRLNNGKGLSCFQWEDLCNDDIDYRPRLKMRLEEIKKTIDTDVDFRVKAYKEGITNLPFTKDYTLIPSEYDPAVASKMIKEAQGNAIGNDERRIPSALKRIDQQ